MPMEVLALLVQLDQQVDVPASAFCWVLNVLLGLEGIESS